MEQKHEAIFPQKSGKIASCFCGSFSSRRPTAAESDSAPYTAPAPCRTQGVRGAADTPPASHDHATLPNEAPCRTQGVRGAADTPPAAHDLAFTSVRDGIYLNGGTGIRIEACTATGFTKRGVRLQGGIRDAVVRDVTADSGDVDFTSSIFPAMS